MSGGGTGGAYTNNQDRPAISRLNSDMRSLTEMHDCDFTSKLERTLINLQPQQEVTFLGAFQQGLVGTDMDLVVPFLFFQTKKQQERLNQGKLQAVGYDVGSFSIEGKITRSDLVFEKVYDDKEINPFKITYSGQISDKEFYEGGWSFTPTDPAEESNVDAEGRFRLMFLDHR